MNIIQQNYKSIIQINNSTPSISHSRGLVFYRKNSSKLFLNNIRGNLFHNQEGFKGGMPSKLNKPVFKKSALLVGINYTKTPNELYGCINDIKNIGKLLTQKGYTCTMLTDLTPIRATKNNILNALKQLLTNAKDGDTLFFHYSGHGTNTLDRNGDELDRRDEMICPCDYNLISDDELNQIIRLHLKPNVTLFALFDSCFSGTVLDLRYNYLPNILNPRVPETKSNVIMISGCMDNQTSADTFINRAWSGAMTNAFLTCVNSSSLNVLITNMRNYLKNNYTQIPQLSSGKLLNINTPTLYF